MSKRILVEFTVILAIGLIAVLLLGAYTNFQFSELEIQIHDSFLVIVPASLFLYFFLWIASVVYLFRSALMLSRKPQSIKAFLLVNSLLIVLTISLLNAIGDLPEFQLNEWDLLLTPLVVFPRLLLVTLCVAEIIGVIVLIVRLRSD